MPDHSDAATEHLIEQRYRALIEHAHDAIAILRPDGTVDYLSDSVREVLGTDPAQREGRSAFEFLHPDDRERVIGEFADVLLDPETTVRTEMRVVHPAGRLRWVEAFARNRVADPAVRGIIVNFTDVTERKQAEDALRASEAFYRVLFDESPLPKWLTDEESLRFFAVNDAALALYGYSREEFLRLTARDLRLPEEIPEMLAQVNDPSLRSSTAHHRRKDGSILTVELHWHPVVAQGRRGRLVSAMDVTERDRLEARLRQAQKMEAVGRLAGGVAHDFNNLLTVILSYVDMATDGMPVDDPNRDLLAEVRNAGTRAADLTRQLLAFSRQQVLRPRVLDLNDVVSSLQKMVRRLLGEDVELSLALAPAVGPIEADPGQIEQVLMNLLVNARDAMPRGGRVVIETQNVTVAPPGDARAPGPDPLAGEVPEGRWVALTVRDNGVGMDAATRAHIFEPFFTTKEAGKGTGLGLSMVYGIVKQSGGHILVESAPGAGATFRLFFARLDKRHDSGPLPPIADVVQGDETVLLVEDADELRAVMVAGLRLRGYTVLAASNPGEALLAAERHPGPIDLLVTDVVLPLMNGRELAERLRASRPGTRVLFMSGYTGDAMTRNGVVADDLAFIQKPFVPDELMRKMREVLAASR